MGLVGSIVAWVIGALLLFVTWSLPGWFDTHVEGWGFIIGVIIGIPVGIIGCVFLFMGFVWLSIER